MNERINELADTAGIDNELSEGWAGDPERIWVATDDELIKFAQLIIAECALLCISRPGPGDDVRTREHCAEQIKEHFGMIDEIE